MNMYDGLWVVEFDSNTNRFGSGVIVLSKGRILGGDAGYYYSGQYEISDDKIKGQVSIKRFDDNCVSVFGDLDDFNLSFYGKVNDYQLSAQGSLENNPQLLLKIKGKKKEDLPS